MPFFFWLSLYIWHLNTFKVHSSSQWNIHQKNTWIESPTQVLSFSQFISINKSDYFISLNNVFQLFSCFFDVLVGQLEIH